MTELFTLVFDIGPGAPVETIATIFTGLDKVAQAAGRLASEFIKAALDEGVRLGMMTIAAGIALTWIL